MVQQAGAQIPWGHNVRILTKLKDRDERLWYIRAAIEQGWSRNVLVTQIESGLYRRQGKAVTNFSATLPGQDELYLWRVRTVGGLQITDKLGAPRWRRLSACSGTSVPPSGCSGPTNRRF